VTDDNTEESYMWEGAEGRMALFPRDQFSEDVDNLFALIRATGKNSHTDVASEVRRIFADNSSDYLEAVGVQVAGAYAGYTLTHPNTFEVSAALINYGLFLIAYRDLVPPTTITPTTLESA